MKFLNFIGFLFSYADFQLKKPLNTERISGKLYNNPFLHASLIS